MTTESKNNINQSEVSQNIFEQQKPDLSKSPPPMTRGEIAGDAINWIFWGGVVNGVISIIATDLAHAGRWQPQINKLEKLIVNKFAIEGKVARDYINKSMLITGGFPTLIPTKYMEDHKVEIAEWLDDKIGKKDLTKQEQKDIDDRYEYLKKVEKPQTWGSVIWSRILMMGVYFGTVATVGSQSSLLKKASSKAPVIDDFVDLVAGKSNSLLKNSSLTKDGVGEYIKKLDKWGDESLAKYGGQSFNRVSGSDRFKKQINNTAMEVTYEGYTSFVAYLFSRFLAPKFTSKTREISVSDHVEIEEKVEGDKGMENIVSANHQPKGDTPDNNISKIEKSHETISDNIGTALKV